eukprot:10287960-Alexandrium_andersonii.AAC.1
MRHARASAWLPTRRTRPASLGLAAAKAAPLSAQQGANAFPGAQAKGSHVWQRPAARGGPWSI